MMDINSLSEQLADTLTRLPEVQLVYLFGSQLTGDVGPMSDYDLGVLVDRDADGWGIRDLLAHELRRTPCMGELGILPADFARHLAPLAGFRNILVDEYVSVDWDQVYQVLQQLEDLERFARLVRDWMQQRLDKGGNR